MKTRNLESLGIGGFSQEIDVGENTGVAILKCELRDSEIETVGDQEWVGGLMRSSGRTYYRLDDLSLSGNVLIQAGIGLFPPLNSKQSEMTNHALY